MRESSHENTTNTSGMGVFLLLIFSMPASQEMERDIMGEEEGGASQEIPPSGEPLPDSEESREGDAKPDSQIFLNEVIEAAGGKIWVLWEKKWDSAEDADVQRLNRATRSIEIVKEGEEVQNLTKDLQDGKIENAENYAERHSKMIDALIADGEYIYENPTLHPDGSIHQQVMVFRLGANDIIHGESYERTVQPRLITRKGQEDDADDGMESVNSEDEGKNVSFDTERETATATHEALVDNVAQVQEGEARGIDAKVAWWQPETSAVEVSEPAGGELEQDDGYEGSFFLLPDTGRVAPMVEVVRSIEVTNDSVDDAPKAERAVMPREEQFEPQAVGMRLDSSDKLDKPQVVEDEPFDDDTY